MSRLGDSIRAARLKAKMTEKALGKKCGILAAVYLLITGYLVGAASTGKRNDSTFAGAYKIRINNAVIRGKLDVFGGTIAVTDSSQISLTDVGNVQYQRGISYGVCPRGFRNQNLQRGKNRRFFAGTGAAVLTAACSWENY